MEITPETKIAEIVDAYPWILDYLPTIAPHFERLKDPAHREKMFHIATVEIASGAAGLTAKQFAEMIQSEIEKREKDPTEHRKEVIKGIIKDLHAGVEMDILRKRFAEVVEGVSATEIAQIEQSLIAEGLPETEVKRLCDVHVEVFKHALDDQDVPRAPAGHPVHTFMVENRANENLIKDIEDFLSEMGAKPGKDVILKHKDSISTFVEKLWLINKRYLRKENQLFPKLESYNVSGPTQVMWAIHDDIRMEIKNARKQIAEDDPSVVATLRSINATISDMIYKEEHILFPLSLETLSDADWVEVMKGDAEIGFSWIEPMVEWKPVLTDEVKAEPLYKVNLDVGVMTPEQVNLMLKHLPLDITYVGDDDRVAYYSGGKERIFPRSPGIIGRAVSRCHPPKSVHIVDNIVNAFKDGTRDEASFWLHLGEKYIYIRYFAVRDETGKYRGTIEVSQDITHIQKIEGEKTLLDWTL
jgi:DUF438 domain-containing protein